MCQGVYYIAMEFIAGRHVSLVDGFTASMPDTEENQKAYPQPQTQKPGLGFPLIRLVVLLSLATAACHGLDWGPYQGKDVRPGPKKDRWQPLYTTSVGDPEDVLTIFRGRQGEEQAFRVEVHDEFVNAVPCGYDKESPDRKRPRFHRGPLQMIGWLVALVYNAVADFAAGLAGAYQGDHVRTLRRMFFNRPGQLYCTPTALIVYLDPFTGQEALLPCIDEFNAAGHRLPCE